MPDRQNKNKTRRQEVQAVKTGEKKESRIAAPKTSTELGIPKTETSLRKFGKQ